MKKVRPDRALSFSIFSFGSFSHSARLALITFLVSISSITVFAQGENFTMPDDVAPPPLKNVSREERDQLAAVPGIKDRAALYLSLMDARLLKAEGFIAREDFSGALDQYGVYQGLLENMMKFLSEEDKSGKVLASFRRIELTLRMHIVRIENSRREMPYQYAFHVSRIQKYIRKSRADATESLFSDSVVRLSETAKKPE